MKLNKNENSETHIDRKIKIAGDAAEILAKYLDEINMEFLNHGIKNAYSLTAEMEQSLLQQLIALNRGVKLSNDDVNNLISNNGRPIDVVTNYLISNEIDPNDLIYSKDLQYRYNSETGQPVQSRKYKNENILIRREGNLRKGMFQLIGWIISILPIFIISLSTLSGNFYTIGSGLIWSCIIFCGFELYSGITGKMYENQNIMIQIRNLSRSFFLLEGALIFGVFINVIKIPYIYGLDTYDTSILNSASYAFQAFLITFVIVEATVFIRDHLKGLYPLESKFKPFVRYLTLPYLILSLSIFIVILGSLFTNIEFYFYQSILFFNILSIILLFAIKFKPSLRFYSATLIIPIITITSFGLDPDLSHLLFLFLIFIQLLLTLIVFYSKNKAYISKELKILSQ